MDMAPERVAALLERAQRAKQQAHARIGELTRQSKEADVRLRQIQGEERAHDRSNRAMAAGKRIREECEQTLNFIIVKIIFQYCQVDVVISRIWR